jgi:non-specific serine/threonine protein kinase
VFVGGWTLEAAHRVCAVEDPVAAIASLVDKSLVRRAPGAGSTARFGMLESLREFATEQLDRTGEREATRARHAAYFSDLGTGIESRVGTGDERAAIEDVGLDVGNLREAVAYHVAAGRPQDALPVSVALGWYSYTRGQLGDGQRSLDAAITAAAGLPETSDEALAGALVMVGAIALGRGDVDTAEARLERGLAVNERVGSVRLRAIGTAFLGHVARTRGRTADAVRRYEEAGRLHGQLANVPGVAWSRYDLGLLARRRHEPDRAADLLRESLCAFRELHYEWAISCSAWALATVELSRGQIREAADLLEEALAAALATDDFRGVAQCFEGAAGVAAAHGAPADAARLLGAADSVRERLAAPLPVDEQGAVGAVRRRVRHSRGNAMADDERAGRALSTAAALALARDVLGRPARNDVPKSAAPAAVPPAPAGPAAQTLTPREAEVADLVRRGCTNRQIARRLGITEKTAEVHVHHIIGKLGAGSRAEIAAWVAGRDLARPPAPAP